MHSELEVNQLYKKRVKLYKELGVDLEKNLESIIEKAEPFSGKVLDVGTGKGYLAVALAKKGYDFRSIDISEEEQNFARLNINYLGLNNKVDFLLEDAEKMPFKEKIFGLIISVNAVHHFKRPFAVIDELIRVLNPEGKMVLADFNDKGLEFVDQIHKIDGRTHNRGQGVSLEEIKEYLLQKGFLVKLITTELEDILICSSKN